MESTSSVQEILGYEFKNVSLLEEALQGGTDPIPPSAFPRTRLASNKPLALIGDALLRLVIVDDGVVEGKTPRDCDQIVRTEACNNNLRRLQGSLHLDRYSAASGSPTTMEAIVGAVWLDCGRDYDLLHPVVHQMRIAKGLARDKNHGSDGY